MRKMLEITTYLFPISAKIPNFITRNEYWQKAYGKKGKKGKKKASPRIKYGHPSNVVPWHAIIKDRLRAHFCGGTIISRRIILTSGFCLSKNAPRLGSYYGTTLYSNPSDYSVFVGTNSPTNKYYDKEGLKVEKVIRHPNYKFKRFNTTDPFFDERGDFTNDVGLIVLQKKLKYTTKVGPACLLTKKRRVKRLGYGVVTGLGADQREGQDFPNPNYPTALKYGFAKEYPNRACWNHYKKEFPSLKLIGLGKKKLCANSNFKKKSGYGILVSYLACKGDEGGSYVISRRNRAYVGGIVSYSPRRCDSISPSIYTRVSHYRNWILKQQKEVSKQKPKNNKGK